MAAMTMDHDAHTMTIGADDVRRIVSALVERTTGKRAGRDFYVAIGVEGDFACVTIGDAYGGNRLGYGEGPGVFDAIQQAMMSVR